MELKYIFQILNEYEDGNITRNDCIDKIKPYACDIIDSNNIDSIKILRGDHFGIKVLYLEYGKIKELKIEYYIAVKKVTLYNGKTSINLTLKL